MFKREIIEQLRQWAASEYRKPLIMRGARQVGKTTVVNQFGKEFTNYLYLNLERPEHATLFNRELSTDDLVNMIFGVLGKVKRKGNTLIFIDEIQNSPQAIARLRYFYEDRPDLHVIGAGSLLENIVDMKVSFPVGRVQYLAVRPCSFREFAQALGRDDILHFLDDPEHSDVVHAQAMALFNQYVIVGGMPEVVAAYAKRRDVLRLNTFYETLLQAYRDDIEKYVSRNKMAQVVRFIIDNGWMQAGNTIRLGNFMESQYRSQEVGEAFRLLERAMLLELVYPTTSAQMPATGELKRSPKLMWLDTGLVNYAAGVRRDLIGANDILDVWRGRIAEHVVAQEILALSNKVSERRMFWVNSHHSAEVDLVWNYNSRLYPIEVKNGHNSRLRSLHAFIDAAPVDVGIRVWSGEFSIDQLHTAGKRKPFTLVNVPFYLVGSLPRIMDMVAEQ